MRRDRPWTYDGQIFVFTALRSFVDPREIYLEEAIKFMPKTTRKK